jgi:Alpha-1,3-glucanase catalytic domain D1/Alpha-1,3-glucanase catalytic domain D2
MSYPSRLLAIILMFPGTPFCSLQASPGAGMPWTTYEAENMTIYGGTVIGPPTPAANINVVVLNTIQMEASGGQAVELTDTDQYVEFTALSNANAIVVRYCVPDTANGTGTNSTISLYVNTNFVQKLPVTSQYSWRYGAYPFSNNPSSGLPRNFFDEVRLIGLTINAGDKVRIEKDADDTATTNIIDLVDLENVAPPLAAPSNSLCITNSPYNADPTGVADSTTALQNCINDARSQLKTVWMPVGTYVISGAINLPSNTTLQGAGMWYTTLAGNASLYNTTPSRRVTLTGNGNYIHLSDFAVSGFLNYRNDSEPNDGLGGAYGIGSTLSRIWVEHTKTGAWLVNSSGLVVDDCRFRDTIADGCNLCVGMRSTTVTNCTARGTGDDCFAVWPATYTTQNYTPGFNVITHCTGQTPDLANGGAIYGGVSNRIEDCAFSDIPYGCGILIAGTFYGSSQTTLFSGTTVAQRCDLTRCGGYDPGWQWRGAVTLCPQYLNITNVNLNHLNITNSLSYAVQIVSPGSSSSVGVLSNATMNLVNISTYGVQVPPYQASPYTNGVYAVWARNDAYGSLKVEGLTINNTPLMSMPVSGSALGNQSGGSPQHFAFDFLPAPTITSSASGNSLQLSWPAIYTGWTLQAQTNASDTGLGANWGTLSGSTAGNQITIPLDNTVGSVFFRLIDR